MAKPTKTVKTSVDTSIKDVADAVRDLKNWVFVFAKEYDLPEEAVTQLHVKLDELGKKLAFLTCK